MYSEGKVTNEGLAGSHGSRLANALDPRVDSDRDGSHNAGFSTTNTGSTNAGPHSVSTPNTLNTRSSLMRQISTNG